MTEQYIFLDIDGTLVDFNGKMPESTKIALQKAHERGHHLILCTGRQRSQIYPWLRAIVPFEGAITSAGAMVMCGGSTVFHKCIAPGKLEKLLRFFEQNRIAYYLQTADALISQPWCVEKTLALFARKGYAPEDLASLFGDTVLDAQAHTRTDIEKVVYYDAGKGIAEVQAAIGADYQIVGYSFSDFGNTSGEISQIGVNKASGICAYLEHCNAQLRNTVAIGDGDNDLDMLALAAQSVAMGNATQALKQAADFVTDSLENDGLYKAFERLHLI